MLEHRACSPRHRVCSWCERVSDGAHNVGAQGVGNDGPATQASTITALNLLTTNCTSVCARLSVSLSLFSLPLYLALSFAVALSLLRARALSLSLTPFLRCVHANGRAGRRGLTPWCGGHQRQAFRRQGWRASEEARVADSKKESLNQTSDYTLN